MCTITVSYETNINILVTALSDLNYCSYSYTSTCSAKYQIITPSSAGVIERVYRRKGDGEKTIKYM